MFCPNCGKKLPSDARFCPDCGNKIAVAPAAAETPAASQTPVVKPAVTAVPSAEPAVTATPAAAETPAASPAPAVEPAATAVPVAEPAVTAAPAAAYTAPAEYYDDYEAPAPKKKTGLLIGIIAGGVVVLVAIIAVLCLSVFQTKTVDLNINDYVTMEVDGYDGYGTVYVDLDYERMQEDYADAKLRWTGKTYPTDMNPVEALEYYTWLDTYYYDGMSNGDVITVDIDLTGLCESNLNVIYDPDYEYTVEGLSPIVELDPFDYFYCEISGSEGNTDYDYGFTDEGIDQYEVLDWFWPEYECEDSLWELKNGDVITFSIEDSIDAEYFAEYYGIEISNATYTYTVADLPVGDHYVTDSAEIPAEYYEGLGNSLGDWISEDWLDKGADDYTYELVGWAFSGEKLGGYDKNIYFVIVKGTLSLDGETVVSYIPTWITDIEYDADTQEYSFWEGDYDSSNVMSTTDDSSYVSGTYGDYTIKTFGLSTREEVVDWINDYVSGNFELEWHLD